ncbi:MAG: 50S ribosomal protein L13 [Bdellovibrionales bacterium]|nr:50S ribosomal protein L13 [Bdellovibrionales bacterium]
METWNAKKEEFGYDTKKWWLVDATDLTVGRMATSIADVLRGKNKPTFTPNVDTGDFVVVINADKIKFSGRKLLQKKYYTRSRFFGSLRELTAEKVLEKKPERVITDAVKGMLPTNKLSYSLMTKLKVYPGADHPHAAQKPEMLNLK